MSFAIYCESYNKTVFLYFKKSHIKSIMFTVIGFMFGGMLLGFLLRRHDMTWIHKVITFLIWMLLLILGIEVGGNKRIIEGLGTIGIEAIVMTIAFVSGSCIFAWALWCVLYKRKGRK